MASPLADPTPRSPHRFLDFLARCHALVWTALLLAAAASSAEGAEGGLTGTWATRAASPTLRTEVAAAALDGKIFLVGGFEKPAVTNLHHLAITPAVQMYDPKTDTWSSRAPLPVGLHHVGIASLGDRLYVIGGFQQSLLSVWKPSASLYVYDSRADRWTEGRPMPTARGALAAAVVGDQIYAIGGLDGHGNTGAVEIYDPASDTWATRAALPTPRDHLAAASVDGRIYAIGGRLDRDYGRNLSVTEMYVPATDTWSRRANLPTARSGITAGVIDGLIYVLGGESPEGTFSESEAYDPMEDRWHTMPPMPTARHGLGSAVVDGALYVMSGGPTPGGSFSAVNEVFTPSARPPTQATPRATPTQVGSIMALLAAFQDAAALPPESSPEANRLIKALIQVQAVLMKSEAPAVHRLLNASLKPLSSTHPSEVDRFRREGWTSESLEAIVDHATSDQFPRSEELDAAFRAFNVDHEDLALLARVFRTARSNLRVQGEDIHHVYHKRRREMPGAPPAGS